MKYIKNLGAEEYKHKHVEPTIEAAPPPLPKVEFSFNRWTFFGLISVFALITALSVASVIQVNSLLRYNNELQKELTRIRNGNESLRAEINKLESPERIASIAKDKLGMIPATTAPEFVNQ
jgi:cell division protein FtsL